MKGFLTIRLVGMAKSDIVFTLLASSIFLPLGRVEAQSFTQHSLTRNIQIFTKVSQVMAHLHNLT